MDSVLMCVHVMWGGGGGGVGGLMMGGRLKGKKILKCRDLIIFTMCHTVK